MVNMMKKILLLILITGIFFLLTTDAAAQCSICTKTAAQLGEKPAKGMNAGILYLAAAPITLIGVIGYYWWKKNGSAP